MKKIEKLTTAQWRRVAEERERWVSIGACTEPADRATTEEVIAGFYRRVGREPPRFLWFDGPASCIVALSLKAAKEDQLGGQLGGQIGGQLRDQLWGQLRGQLWGQLRGQLLSLLSNGWYLAQPGYWAGHYAACHDVAGAEYRKQNDELLREWERLAGASGWWFPGTTLCLCAERDERIRFDTERRLHAVDGPAILCRDGYAVYAWHGTRTPAEWITTPDDVDPKLALTWDNIEQRRCLAEIIGWDRVLEQLSPQTIDEDTPEVGTLLRVDLPDSPGEQFLRVRCGTGRTFVLPVPPDVATARQANAWTYGLDADTFKPEIRT